MHDGTLSDADRERLEALRDAVLLLRIPLLLAGLLQGLYGLLSGLGSLLSITQYLFVMGTPTSWLLLGSMSALSLVVAILDLVAAGFLLRSGALGLLGRTEPEHLPAAMHSLRRFWYVLGVRLIAGVGSMIGQAVGFGLMGIA